MTYRTSPEAIDRFWSKVTKTPGCWTWSGSMRSDGYAVFSLIGRMVRAHRLAYELVVGEIPTGLELDHLCRNPGCVNPAHLEPVTRAENMRRADVAWRSRRTHCVNGHEFVPENYSVWRGMRMCLRCREIKAARWRQRIKDDPERLERRNEMQRERRARQRSAA